MRNITFAVLICTAIYACTNREPEIEDKKLTQPVDTNSTQSRQPLTDLPEQEHYEINGYDTFPPAQLTLKYGNSVDTIYGNIDNHRILYTNGDIKMKYPPSGTRGIGTNELWDVANKNTVKNKIIVHYKINSSYPDREKIKTALSWWSSNTKVEFVESVADDFIEFVPSLYTQSYVGKIGGRQTIELADWAMEGNIAHEIGHALGLYHEHMRSDRDQFVTVNCPNNNNYRHAFKQDPYAKDVDQYSFYSIMHYPATECMSVPDNIRKRYNLPNNIPGQRKKVDSTDHKAIKILYDLR